MAMWNPWKGCKKCSDGCRYCYIYKGNAKRGVDTSIIEKTKDFAKPTERLKNGNYNMKSGIVMNGETLSHALSQKPSGFCQPSQKNT